MEKNWLIRTKSNHILGPISKEKVLELYSNGSIKSDDEICSGNGYWFFIREEELVDRYLLNDEIQSFNPISEAKDILTTSGRRDQTSDDITTVGNLNIEMLKNSNTSASPKSSTTVIRAADAIPALNQSKAPVKEVPLQLMEIKKKTNLNVKNKPIPVPPVPLKRQEYLKYLGIVGLVLLVLLIYFRKSIIRAIASEEVTSYSVNFMNSAHAQDDVQQKKKSSLKIQSFSKK